MAVSSTQSRRPRLTQSSSLGRIGLAAAYLLPALIIGAIGLGRPISTLAADPGYLDSTTATGAAAAIDDQDLTAVGPTDWAVWGYATSGTSTSLAPDVRKAGGTAISDLETIVASDNDLIALRGLGQFASEVPWRFDWSNGDIVQSADDAVVGLQWNGHDALNAIGQDVTGYGFQFTVPAGIEPQRLFVYTHAHGSVGRLNATLSDGSSAPIVSSYGDYGGNRPGLFTIDFAAGSDLQTLTVTYVMNDRSDINPDNYISANPAIYAVALAPQLVENGGFERTPLADTGFVTRPAGSTAMPGWTIGADGIDQILNQWQPADGRQNVDLGASGVSPGDGSVSQSISTQPGASYLLSFAYSANPDAGPGAPNAAMTVAWGGETFPVTTVRPPSPSNMDWQRFSQVVTGADASELTSLSFVQTAGGVFGVALDDVSVTPIGDGDTGPVEVDAPVLIDVVPSGPNTGVVGRLPEVPGTYIIEFVTSDTCADGQLSGDPVTFGQTTITIPAPGVGEPIASYFGGTIVNQAVVETYAAARIVGPAPQTSGLSDCIIAGPNNNNWFDALPLDISDGEALVNGFLDSEGNARWFKFSIVPGARATVDLSSLPDDFDLLVYKDIKQVYEADLDGPLDLTQTSAEFAPSAYAPSAYAPSAYAPSAYAPSAYAPSAYAPSAYAPSAYAPSAYAPSAYAPSAYAPSAYAPSAYAPSAYAPSAYAPSAYAPSAYAPDTFSPSAYASAQVRSLIAVSALDGPSPESIVVDTWNNTGDFYIRVSGKNGAFDPEDSFRLDVTFESGACGDVEPESGTPTVLPGDFTTIIVTDSSRIPGSATMLTNLQTFANRPEINGVIVDIAARDGLQPNGQPSTTEPNDLAYIRTLNGQADTEYACPYAKNLVAGAIKGVIDAYRTASDDPGTANDLRYVVIVGGDDAIPFYRYPDQSLLGPEEDYYPPVGGQTASEASLRSNYVLGQDEYGAATTISLRASTFPVPALAVGRLVETASDVNTMLAAYAATGDGVVDTTASSLVTGYDFIADAADEIRGHLSDGTGTPSQSLITPFGVSHLDTVDDPAVPGNDASWNAAQLRSALLASRHDLIFLGGHFSANEALAADFSTKLVSTEITAPSVPANLFLNSIIFSIGCHAGYNIVDQDRIDGVTQPVDWSQAFASEGASLIAGTGYQYGDTDFIEYSERIYAEFARQLRVGTGAVSIGEALVRAKQAYLRSTPDIRGLHEKALLESTLFGLPMLSVNLPAGRLPAELDDSVIDGTDGYGGTGAGAELDLQFADLTVNPDLDEVDRQLTSLGGGSIESTFFTGPDGIATNPLEPTLPLDVQNVSVDGYVLRGVGFRGGTYTERQVTPLTGAPNTEIRGVHVPFASNVLYPIRLTTPNYFDALGAPDGATRLLITPVQHVTESIGDQESTARIFSQIGLRLFYSNNTDETDGHTAALSGPPEISGVQAEVNGTTVTFRARVVGDPAAGVQEVWVTYTGHANQWVSLDLEQNGDDSTLWEGVVTLPSTANLRYMVQAVNGVGLVTISDLLGSFHTAAIAGAPAPVIATSTLSLAGSPTAGVFGSTPTVTATLDSEVGVDISDKTIVFTLGGAVRIATTNASGIATTPIDVSTSSDTQLSATFYGDSSVAAAAATQGFTVTKAPTQLTLSGPTFLALNQKGVFAATLKSGDVSLTQRTIAFTFTAPNGTKTVKVATTDISGVARIDAIAAPVGTHKVTADFGSAVPLPPPAGGTLDLTDAAYAASSSTPVNEYLVRAQKYAFSSRRDGNIEIYTMNPDGTGQTRRTNHSGTDTEASFSPDGKQIVFSSTRTGLGDIYKMNADGTGLVRLTTSTAIDGAPAWSPDGSKIAFTSRRDGNFEIYVMNASNGSGQTRLTNNSAIDNEPEWSPNGAKISFTSTRTGAGDIYVMNANGSEVTRLTTHVAIDGTSAWSPDGTTIAFTSRRDGDFEIFTMNANGTAQTQRTSHNAIDTEPVWTPDGSKILFGSTRNGLGDIYAMNPDGSGVVRLTTHTAIDNSPAAG